MKLFACLLLVPLLVLSCSAQAAVFDDEAYQRLFDEGRGDELLREAKTRGGPEALAAESLGLLRGPQADQALAPAERCVQQQAQQAACHFALASALALKAERDGWLKALRVAGRVRNAYAEALRLRADMTEARVLLHVIYVALPAALGGSADKARQLESEAPPELARVLRARSALQAKRVEEAERELLAVRPGADRSLQNALVSAWGAMVKHWNKTNEHAQARRRLEALAQQLPALAEPLYLLARVAGDAGQHEDAIRLLERARGLSGAALLPLDYRIGIAWQDLGQADKARAALRRFLDAQRGSADNLKDAARRLQQLG